MRALAKANLALRFLLVAPKARLEAPRAVRFAVELAIFGAAALAWPTSGAPPLASPSPPRRWRAAR